MEEQKNQASSDKGVADLATKLAAGKPMQAGKFTEETKAAMADVVTGVSALGESFDKALIALKAGKTAHRKIWVDKEGTVNLNLVPAITEAGVTGMNFQRGDVTSRAGLHNNDMLANDWVIV